MKGFLKKNKNKQFFVFKKNEKLSSLLIFIIITSKNCITLEIHKVEKNKMTRIFLKQNIKFYRNLLIDFFY